MGKSFRLKLLDRGFDTEERARAVRGVERGKKKGGALEKIRSRSSGTDLIIVLLVAGILVLVFLSFLVWKKLF